MENDNLKHPLIHDWDEKSSIGQRGIELATQFLESPVCTSSWHATEMVHLVDSDERYFGHDIDLLWVIPQAEFLRCITIEVKADTTKHPNFFCETMSVEESGKVGNIVVTRAEWLFYSFINTGYLYCIPMEQFRPWFTRVMLEFQERKVKSLRKKTNTKWTSCGRLVPIERVLKDIQGVRVYLNVVTDGTSTWSAVPAASL